jgi:hypothetical protein
VTQFLTQICTEVTPSSVRSTDINITVVWNVTPCMFEGTPTFRWNKGPRGHCSGIWKCIPEMPGSNLIRHPLILSFPVIVPSPSKEIPGHNYVTLRPAFPRSIQIHADPVFRCCLSVCHLTTPYKTRCIHLQSGINRQYEIWSTMAQYVKTWKDRRPNNYVFFKQRTKINKTM